MKAILILATITGLAMTSANASNPELLFAFDDTGDKSWTTVHDTVMGGRSEGGSDLRDGILRFRGNLSLENNGGFASIRHVARLDLSGRSGIRLRVRGDGRSYQLRFHTDSRYYGRPVAYAAEFETRAGEWTEVEVPFDRLQATFRGRRMEGYRFDPTKITLVGILLGDKQAGPFSLDIDRISAY